MIQKLLVGFIYDLIKSLHDNVNNENVFLGVILLSELVLFHATSMSMVFLGKRVKTPDFRKFIKIKNSLLEIILVVILPYYSRQSLIGKLFKVGKHEVEIRKDRNQKSIRKLYFQTIAHSKILEHISKTYSYDELNLMFKYFYGIHSKDIDKDDFYLLRLNEISNHGYKSQEDLGTRQRFMIIVMLEYWGYDMLKHHLNVGVESKRTEERKHDISAFVEISINGKQNDSVKAKIVNAGKCTKADLIKSLGIVINNGLKYNSGDKIESIKISKYEGNNIETPIDALCINQYKLEKSEGICYLGLRVNENSQEGLFKLIN